MDEKKNGKKKVIAISVVSVVALIVIIIVCIFGKGNEELENTENTTDKLELTSDMIYEIKEKVNDDWFDDSILLYHDLLYSDDYEFNSLSITNQKQTDKYTYTVYAKIYFVDNFKNKMYDEITIVFTAEKDETQAKGYSTSWVIP